MTNLNITITDVDMGLVGDGTYRVTAYKHRSGNWSVDLPFGREPLLVTDGWVQARRF